MLLTLVQILAASLLIAVGLMERRSRDRRAREAVRRRIARLDELGRRPPPVHDAMAVLRLVPRPPDPDDLCMVPEGHVVATWGRAPRVSVARFVGWGRVELSLPGMLRGELRGDAEGLARALGRLL